MSLELSRQRARKHALDNFKHIRTCALAREFCFLVRTNIAVLDKEDAQACCGFVSKLCREAGCEEAGDLCAEAAQIVMGSEEAYLKLCEQSCKRCSESRQPRRPAPERAVYVA